MRTSQAGINMVKQFEGLRLQAYMIKNEKYYTIGYGHSGSDVHSGQCITESTAENFLKEDLKKFEVSVEKAVKDGKLIFPLNQNQFDALVSFTYNCGAGNLHKLVEGRNAQTVADKMLLYCNGANPNVKAGLLERRKKERSLFLDGAVNEHKSEKPQQTASTDKKLGQVIKKVNAKKGLNLRDKPGTDGKCIMGLLNGTSVTVLEQIDQSWCKVSLTGKNVTGYCSAEYLK